MVQTVFLHIEKAVVPVDILVFHQVNNLIWVLVHIDYQLQLALDLILHELTRVGRVVELRLDVIDKLIQRQTHSQRIDVLSEDTILSWLTQYLLKNLHDDFGLLLLHERSQSLQKGDLDLILG